ncbi:MAG: hypothetical protein KBA51_09360, partial [Kiritimatiellae bacterium]|nr:hypothetical protein [Kiritimatiellia bacterium]
GGDSENPGVIVDEGTATVAPADVPNIEGSWNGSYQSPTESRGLTAEIDQAGRRLTILTSLPGEGQVFTGYFRDNGSIYLEDGTTGEIWTSIGGISSSRFTIRDYLYDSNLGTNSPEQDIFFSR